MWSHMPGGSFLQPRVNVPPATSHYPLTEGVAKSKLSSLEAAWITYPLSVGLASSTGEMELTIVYRAKGDEAKAEGVLRRAADVIPENAGTHHGLNSYLLRQGCTKAG